MIRVQPGGLPPIRNHLPEENSLCSKITAVALAILASLSSFFFLPAEGALCLVGIVTVAAIGFAFGYNPLSASEIAREPVGLRGRRPPGLGVDTILDLAPLLNPLPAPRAAAGRRVHFEREPVEHRNAPAAPPLREREPVGHPPAPAQPPAPPPPGEREPVGRRE